MALDPRRPASTVPILALVLLGALGPAPLTAATLTVTDCGDSGAPGQLRTLINTAAPGDAILVPACTVTLTGAAGEDLNAGGDLDILTGITIRGSGPGLTVIDGGAIDRVIDVPVGVTAALFDLTIQNGGNVEPFGGGGVRNAGSLTLERVTVQGNHGGVFAQGGGILNNGSLIATEVTVQRNGAKFGGGLGNGGSVTLTNSTISGNNTFGLLFSDFGGGIANGGTALLSNVTISGNTSALAGGIFNTGTTVLTNVTLSNNTSIFTGGLFAMSGTLTLGNTILAASGCNVGAATLPISLGHNVADDASCSLTGPGDRVVADLELGPLAAHGGSTETRALLPGSPAIDAGDPAACPATDQRGVARPLPGRCAIGAVEPVPMFPGGVHVGAGDVDGDGAAEIVTGADAGGGPHVRVWTRTGSPPAALTGFFAYDPAFPGGVRVAACDFDGDTRAEIVTGAGPGGGPHVRVIKLGPGPVVAPAADLASFYAYDPAFTGGVFVACGNVEGLPGPGMNIITGADARGGAHVRVFRLQPGAPGGVVPVIEFFAYDAGFLGGVRVAAGDIDGSGRASIVTGAGPGGGPHVRAFKWTGSSLVEVASFFAYDPGFTGGVYVAAGRLSAAGPARIVTGAGAGGGPHVRVFDAGGIDVGSGFFATAPAVAVGVHVGVAEVPGAPGLILTAPGPGTEPYVRRFTPSPIPLDAGFFAY